MKKILGQNFRILNHKLVMGVPESYLPEWIKLLIKNNTSNNLGKYIKPKYRDITYFKGLDFHQDIIDYPYRTADFINKLNNEKNFKSIFYYSYDSFYFFLHKEFLKNKDLFIR